MEAGEHLWRLVENVGRMRSVLAVGDLAAGVTGCPGWTLADLGAHIGGVYRFATAGLDGRGVEIAEPAIERRDELLAWFDGGAAALLERLRGIAQSDGWEEPAWTLAPPASAMFWARRQHHETALHLWDALDSQGATRAEAAVGLDPESAADGIDEVATMFFPRQVRLGRMAPLPQSLTIRLPDRPDVVLAADPAAPAAPSDAMLEGDPAAVLLALWKRLPLTDPALRTTGRAAHILAEPITP